MTKRRPNPRPAYQPPRLLGVDIEWDLLRKMRDLAAADRRAEDLAYLADRLEAAFYGFFREPQIITTEAWLAAYRPAVALYCRITDEDPGPDIGEDGFERLRIAALLQSVKQGLDFPMN